MLVMSFFDALLIGEGIKFNDFSKYNGIIIKEIGPNSSVNEMFTDYISNKSDPSHIINRIRAYLAMANEQKRTDSTNKSLSIRLNNLVNENIEKNFNVKSLAKDLSTNVNTLNIHLNKVTGMSTMQYVLAIKASYAAKLLSSQNLSLTRIAYDLGYSSPSAFSIAFKRHYGVSPRAYRNKLRIDKNTLTSEKF